MCFKSSSIIGEIPLELLGAGLLINEGNTMVGSNIKNFDFFPSILTKRAFREESSKDFGHLEQSKTIALQMKELAHYF